MAYQLNTLFKSLTREQKETVKFHLSQLPVCDAKGYVQFPRLYNITARSQLNRLPIKYHNPVENWMLPTITGYDMGVTFTIAAFTIAAFPMIGFVFDNGLNLFMVEKERFKRGDFAAMKKSDCQLLFKPPVYHVAAKTNINTQAMVTDDQQFLLVLCGATASVFDVLQFKINRGYGQIQKKIFYQSSICTVTDKKFEKFNNVKTSDIILKLTKNNDTTTCWLICQGKVAWFKICGYSN
jgi:hypothetical protein